MFIAPNGNEVRTSSQEKKKDQWPQDLVEDQLQFQFFELTGEVDQILQGRRLQEMRP